MTATPPWQPKNPGWEAVARGSFTRQRHMATLGAEIIHLAAGEAHLAAPFAPQFTQQNGFWHAGAIASLADSACGYAAFSLAPAGSDVLAVEFKISLLSPAKGRRFVAKARVLRPGRTITACQADVWAEDTGADVLVATMLSTIIIRSASGTRDSEER